jgi:hypothetical protein
VMAVRLDVLVGLLLLRAILIFGHLFLLGGIPFAPSARFSH